MRLVTWNVQWCCGLDGTVNPARIAARVRRIDTDGRSRASDHQPVAIELP